MSQAYITHRLKYGQQECCGLEIIENNVSYILKHKSKISGLYRDPRTSDRDE